MYRSEESKGCHPPSTTLTMDSSILKPRSVTSSIREWSPVVAMYATPRILPTLKSMIVAETGCPCLL